MVKHMIIWKLKEGIDKDAVSADIKASLEVLQEKLKVLLKCTF